ncbi:MAG: acyl carrier protein [Bacteroidota bacterium]
MLQRMRGEETMREIIITEIKTSIARDQEMDLTPEEDILTTGVLDSLGVMKLVSFIQEQFSIAIDPGEMVIENFINVLAMESFIKSKLASA